MKRLTITAALAAALASLPAAAEQSLKGGYVACTREELFDQYLQALIDENLQALRRLSRLGCLVPASGTPVTVLDTKLFSGKAKVRAHTARGSVELWTNIENVQTGGARKPSGSGGGTSTAPKKPSPTEKLLGYYTGEPGADSGHRVTVYINSTSDPGFYFTPPLEEKNPVLFQAAAWAVNKHFRDERAHDMAYYVSDGKITLTGHGGEYRAKILSNGAGHVHGLLFIKARRARN